MALYDRAPRKIPQTLQTLVDAVSDATGTDFNFVLMNFYQDGTHSISYHSDDEKFLGTHDSNVYFLLPTLPSGGWTASGMPHLQQSVTGRHCICSNDFGLCNALQV